VLSPHLGSGNQADLGRFATVLLRSPWPALAALSERPAQNWSDNSQIPDFQVLMGTLLEIRPTNVDDLERYMG
jgi:hypothetical protein